MDRKILKITACYFVFLGLLVQSCAPTKTLVTLQKEKISTLKKVGIISVYEPVGPQKGPYEHVFHKKAIEEDKKKFREASPAPMILEKFTMRLTTLCGIAPIIIGEYEPEVVSIKETRGPAKRDYYALETLDYSSLRKRFNIDNLIVLRTYDRTFFQGGGTTRRYLILSLTTIAKLINLNNYEMVWHKEIKTMSKRKVGKQIIDFDRHGDFSVHSVKMASYPQILYIVDELIKDFTGIGIPAGSAETERDQQAVSPEKSSQEQTQQKEASKDSGIISITSDPPGAKIFIDGEFKGQTPAEISLSTGTYQIFLQRQLYEPYRESVVIEKGQTKTLNIRLSPEGKEQK